MADTSRAKAPGAEHKGTCILFAVDSGYLRGNNSRLLRASRAVESEARSTRDCNSRHRLPVVSCSRSDRTKAQTTILVSHTRLASAVQRCRNRICAQLANIALGKRLRSDLADLHHELSRGYSG
jgi:hypothetical protein